MNILLNIDVWRDKDFHLLQPKDYENLCENPYVKNLLREGQVHVKYGDTSFMDEIAKLSKKVPGAVFQITEFGPRFYRYWFTDGKWSSSEGEITFDEYRPLDLEPYDLEEIS